MACASCGLARRPHATKLFELGGSGVLEALPTVCAE